MVVQRTRVRACALCVVTPVAFSFDSHTWVLCLLLAAQALARRQLVELKNGRLAMIATAGMLHHYFLTGKGPIELITGGGSA